MIESLSNFYYNCLKHYYMNIIFLFWLFFFVAVGFYLFSQKNINSKTQPRVIVNDDTDVLEAIEDQYFPN